MTDKTWPALPLLSFASVCRHNRGRRSFQPDAACLINRWPAQKPSLIRIKTSRSARAPIVLGFC
ncbi:hypothetical protein KCP70_02400 [Salmonella enterica subsp. enterica]|nr:hypothetical protein KCP70_02400 [Salmonella enterica subsp. enterica]